MKRFGEELKNARESKNISLQDISKATRINVKFIEAIEVGNLSILPPTYIRAFIKSYAKNVGLNQEETIARYEQYSSGKTPEPLPINWIIEKTDDEQSGAKKTQVDEPTKATEPDSKKTTTPEPIVSESTAKSTSDISAKPKSTIDISTMPKTTSDIATKNISENKLSSQEESKVLSNPDYNAPKQHVNYVETPKVNYLAIFSVIAIVIALLVLVVFKVPFKEILEPERIPIDTIVKEMEEQKEVEQNVLLVPESAVALPTIDPDSLLLGILTESDVWVSVRMDKEGADRGMVSANSMKYVKAKERFTVTAVRGNQIKIYLNNNLLGNLSQTDSLRTAVITLNGITYVKPTTPAPLPRNDDTDLKPLEPVFR